MTDEEFAVLMQKLGPAGAGLKSESEVAGTYTAPSPLESRYAISNVPTGAPGLSDARELARETVKQNRLQLDQPPTYRPEALGTTGAIMSVLAPERPQPESVDSSAFENFITREMKWHQKDAAQNQAKLSNAIATLGDLDSTDSEKDRAHTDIQNIPTSVNQRTGNLNVVSPVLETDPHLVDAFRWLDPTKQDDRNKFVSNITPPQTREGAAASQLANLGTGPSWRALQDLGIQFPGVTGKYATAPVFQPNAPPPAQKIQRAQMVPGQTTDAQGNAIPAPSSNIGLTTVRGTEFGQVDNPARGGYTEANWNVGAWGGDISSKTDPFVALPVSVLNKYGDSNSAKFADEFNSKYEVQVIDPNTGKAVSATIRDKGPGARTGAGIDMGWGTREQLGLPVGYSGNISYRIVPKGSALPDNTTASVQQTQANAGGTTDQNFTASAHPAEVYIKPINPKDVKDPYTKGSTMTTADTALWARHQTNEYAAQMDAAGMPMTMDEYKAQYAKFFESGQKYQNPEIKLEPVSEAHNDQFNSLAALTSPTGSVDVQGNKMSQLDLLEKSFVDAKNATPKTGAMFQFPPQAVGGYNEKVALYEAQAEHLKTNIARGVQSQLGNLSETEQANAAKLMPLPGDSIEVGKAKIAMLRASIQDQMRRVISLNKAEHRDTTGLENSYRQIFVKGRVQERADQAAITKSAADKLAANQPRQQGPSQAGIRGGPPLSFQ